MHRACLFRCDVMDNLRAEDKRCVYVVQKKRLTMSLTKGDVSRFVIETKKRLTPSHGHKQADDEESEADAIVPWSEFGHEGDVLAC